MIRDMELIRKILLTIEKEYIDVVLYNIKIEEYDMKEVAYHCNLLYQGGLVNNYKGSYADNELHSFAVGSLTLEGHDLLDKIRDDSTWGKTVSVMKEKVLPFTIENVKAVASAIIQTALQGALSAITKGLI